MGLASFSNSSRRSSRWRCKGQNRASAVIGQGREAKAGAAGEGSLGLGSSHRRRFVRSPIHSLKVNRSSHYFFMRESASQVCSKIAARFQMPLFLRLSVVIRHWSSWNKWMCFAWAFECNLPEAILQRLSGSGSGAVAREGRSVPVRETRRLF